MDEERILIVTDSHSYFIYDLIASQAVCGRKSLQFREILQKYSGCMTILLNINDKLSK